MQPLPHRYRVRLDGGLAGHATVAAPGVSDLRAVPPADFGGPGRACSPGQLLLAAVETCFLFTLRVVAQASRVPFHRPRAVRRGDGAMRFTEIVLRPRLTVPPGTERERALRVMEKSGRACLVSASLATPIRLEPDVVSG